MMFNKVQILTAIFALVLWYIVSKYVDWTFRVMGYKDND